MSNRLTNGLDNRLYNVRKHSKSLSAVKYIACFTKAAVRRTSSCAIVNLLTYITGHVLVRGWRRGLCALRFWSGQFERSEAHGETFSLQALHGGRIACRTVWSQNSKLRIKSAAVSILITLKCQKQLQTRYWVQDDRYVSYLYSRVDTVYQADKMDYPNYSLFTTADSVMKQSKSAERWLCIPIQMQQRKTLIVAGSVSIY